MRPRTPHRPTDPLERLLLRIGREARAVWIDPELPARVEHEIRERARTEPASARCLPRWAAVAAVILAAVGAGSSAGHRTDCASQAPPPPEVEGPLAPGPPPPPFEGAEGADVPHLGAPGAPREDPGTPPQRDAGLR